MRSGARLIEEEELLEEAPLPLVTCCSSMLVDNVKCDMNKKKKGREEEEGREAGHGLLKQDPSLCFRVAEGRTRGCESACLWFVEVREEEKEGNRAKRNERARE